MICANCGESYHHYQGREGERGKGIYCCCRDCFLALPFPLHPHITVAAVKRVARLTVSKRAAAKALDVSYPQYRRAMQKLQMGGAA